MIQLNLSSILLVNFLASMLIMTGCATIISGTEQEIKITSVPEAAHVKIERFTGSLAINHWEGITPTKVKLHRKSSFLATIELDGYERVEITIEYGSMNGWTWGNILLGGVIGIFVDAATGASINLAPDEIIVELVAIRQQGKSDSTSVYALLRSLNSEGVQRAHALPLKPSKKD